MELFVRTDTHGVGVVTPQGRLNMVSAPRLRTAVNEMVDGGTHRVVVDLSETTFVDSSGLGALVGGLKAARQAGGDLRVAGVTPAVRSALELTNLHGLLQPRPTVAEAFSEQEILDG
jgi:anti-sigma B factor antagonist